MSETITETRLENGLTILTDKMSGVRSATLGFFYKIGARHEPTELAGISHFIEHTVFKGTAKRTALDIAIEQDRLGGNLDAFTTHEETGFAIKVIDDQLPQAFDLIADMLMTPLFTDADLRSEQKVIIEEMKMVDDSPDEQLGDIFNEAFFPAHPLGRSIAGTPKSVRTFDHTLTRDYHKRAFHPGNLVIAAAGNVDHRRVAVLIRKSQLGSPVSANGFDTAISAPSAAAPIIIKKNTNLEQAHLIMAMPFPAATDERRYAADLLANIIGGGTSSRLWQKVREEHGLAYSVGASCVMYKDCGLFSVFAATSPEQVGEVIDLSVAELSRAAADAVTIDELELVKQQSRASVLLSLEDSASRAAALAQCEMVHGRQISIDETLAKLDAVTIDDCRALTEEFFRTEHIALGVLGNVGKLKIDRDRLAISS